jgi:hypothetical protein
MINVQGHRVLLAVLTEHNPSERDGTDLVQHLASTAVSGVDPPPLPTIH